MIGQDNKIMPIRIFGDPVLRKKTQAIENIDGSIARLARGMVESLSQARGLGLAAPQVGQSKSICIINLPLLDEKVKQPLVVINPRIHLREGEVIYEEGCLSFPGIYAEVSRPKKIALSGFDLDGNALEYEADDILARVFLHEADHLDGVLFIDHLSTIKRQLLKTKLKKLNQD
ncbi:MAG: peptide deformylase [Candidatus Edwardsbacteria bacterium]|nr:peptide deformylase [Candidatus Edwardsbacteria bacterium]